MMKKYLSIILIGLAVASSGCKKTYLQELGTGPNSPTAANPDLLLSGALKIAVDIPNVNYQQYASWGGYLSWNSTQYQEDHQLEAYQFTTADFDVWTPLYGNISNWHQLSLITTDPYYLAISKIMTVFDYEQLVDNYEDVPYSQALEGNANLTPKFDKGSAIYDDLFVQLDAAISLIQKAPAGTIAPTTSDFMYAGKMTYWEKFANTLKLKLAVTEWTNVTAKRSALVTEIASTSTIGYIDGSATAPAASANPGYQSSDANGGKQSPLWLTYGFTASGQTETDNKEYCANLYAITKLNALNDPRIQYIYSTDPQGEISGLPFGTLGQEPDGSTPSTYGPGILISPTMNGVILAGSESDFLQAEAAANGLITADPAALYTAGVTISFSELQDPTAADDATAYLIPNSYANAVASYGGNAVEAIINQKWIALFGYGALSMYNDYRRTGFPNDIPLSITPGANAPNNITRIQYPAIVYQTNADNVGAEPTIDKFNSVIFWGTAGANLK
jgi:hypothetical protein